MKFEIKSHTDCSFVSVVTIIARKMRLFKKSNICFHCLKPIASPDKATIEHKIPLSKGGSNRDDNLALAHGSCNSDHGNKLPKVKK